ncbi:IgGFc-binding protein [Paraglaciecola sp. 25GB23A]|uniref:IgGFc-binding protein n=1 Tax=Paraglaciecola sp. 25GB23A TaxID=3156068 RepID=UPI0032AF4A3F
MSNILSTIKLFKRTGCIALLSVFVLTISSASLAAVDNKGTEFIIAYNPNFDTAVTIEMHLTSDVVTSVDINYPMNAPTFTDTVVVTPGIITVVTLPISAATSGFANSIQDNAVHVIANDEFVVYTVNRRDSSTDAALALPVDTMNTEYIVSGYTPLFNSQFAVYASQDATTVTITPTNALVGHAAGTPFDVSLNRGEVFYGSSASSGVGGNLTGTAISASRPIGMINGNRCVNVPVGTAACDHIYEVAQPVQSWGLTAAAANLPNRTNGTIYRIVASEDNTEVSINGVVQGTINRSEFIETSSLTGNQFFSADRPIFVTQYMTGINSAGATLGDPAMGNMIPTEQYLANYTFSTVGDTQFVEDYVTIIANNADVGTLLLDGVAVPAASFTAIPSINFSSAVLPIADGTHTTVSANPHGITVQGFDSADSYIYPGGALFGFINQTGDPFLPICSVSTSGDLASGSISDNTNDEDSNNNGVIDPGEDTNNNGVLDADTGVFFVNVLTSNNTSVDVDPFNPGDGQVNVSIMRVDGALAGNASVEGIDGAGNSCLMEVVFDSNAGLMCDVDVDGDIDRLDLRAISLARGQTALPNDPRDSDMNGVISPADVKRCIPQCTAPGCAIQ